jgi:hypothetical protein
MVRTRDRFMGWLLQWKLDDRRPHSIRDRASKQSSVEADSRRAGTPFDDANTFSNIRARIGRTCSRNRPVRTMPAGPQNAVDPARSATARAGLPAPGTSRGQLRELPTPIQIITWEWWTGSSSTARCLRTLPAAIARGRRRRTEPHGRPWCTRPRRMPTRPERYPCRCRTARGRS